MQAIGTIVLIVCVVFIGKAQSGTMIDSRDGKVYKTVQIGTQTWMAENLAYADSSITYLFLKHSVIKNGIYCYGDDTTLIAQYGLLYSWDAAMKSCLVGWHLPSKAEYDTLLAYAGPDIKTVYDHLKIGGGTGFEATLGEVLGFLSSGVGHYGNINVIGKYWTSTGKSNTIDFYCIAINGWLRQCTVGICPKFHHKKASYPFCMSVRCIKD